MTWVANGATDPNNTNVSLAFTQPGLVAEDPNGVGNLVADGWQTAMDYANRAFEAAQTFLNTLQASATAGTPYIDPNLQALDLNIAQFDSLLGTLPANPSNTFAFTEVPYSSTLLTDLRARLLEWVDGASTGLAPSVEQAIWDRGRAREVVASSRKAKEAIRSFAMLGFSKPQGALSLELQDAAQEAQNTSNTLSREVMIKQADLEQSNRRFSLEQAEKMEEALIAYTSQQAARVLEAAKAFQQFVIEIYSEQIKAYNTEAQVYNSCVTSETAAFKAKTDVNIAEANTRIEAARIQLQTWVQQLTLKVEVAKAGAQVSAQLAAAALSAISVHGQMGTSVTNSAGNSTSQSLGVSNQIQTSLGLNYQYSGSA